MWGKKPSLYSKDTSESEVFDTSLCNKGHHQGKKAINQSIKMAAMLICHKTVIFSPWWWENFYLFFFLPICWPFRQSQSLCICTIAPILNSSSYSGPKVLPDKWSKPWDYPFSPHGLSPNSSETSKHQPPAVVDRPRASCLFHSLWWAPSTSHAEKGP